MGGDRVDVAVPFLVAACALVGACTPGTTGDTGDPGSKLDLSMFEVAPVRVPCELYSDLAWLDEGRLAGVVVESQGEVFCPDCQTIPIEECPEVCERELVDLWVLAHDGSAVDGPRRVLTYFPASFDHDLRMAHVEPLGDDTLAMVWQECDNQTCGGFFASRTCTARYQRVGLDGTVLSDPVTLYEDWFGDVEIAVDPDAGRLLVVHHSIRGCYTGVRAAQFTLGGEPASSWVSLGSIEGDLPSVVRQDGQFVVTTTDPRPGGQPAAPCVSSCECGCGALVTDPPEDGGISAWWIDAGGTARREVVTSTDDGDEYLWPEQLAASAGDGFIVAASPHSTPATVFERGAEGGWTVRHQSDPVNGLWFDAQLTRGGHAFWLGSEQTDDTDYLVATLVAGASAADGRGGRGPIEDPLRSYVFDFSVAGGALDGGAHRVFLLRGVWEDGASPGWDRFELVRVDVAATW